MKGSKTCLVLIATSLFFLQGFEDQEDRIFQTNRCALAAAMGLNSDPSIVTKAAVEIREYMRERGINKSFAELTAITNKIQAEIMGPPDSPLQEWEDRARKITESNFCRKYLSNLSQE
ncbi:hypothetical protein [Pseudomonas chlororaphis]|uniref:hypothetical protein n=1 Tax=Pseudomonas chlororaphis TaxID=587753 RepID=UPI000D10FB3C|nr:hypothetical protein [Pseudomonas chlororaphis]AVO58316.1 hypothetical protein C6Q18_10210 [Pseudomonas chlororaphis subsp. piscium]WMJ01991.1 hypothetical protein RBU55_10705 [Pseudomonas chlororaphis subsp. aurantiaca]